MVRRKYLTATSQLYRQLYKILRGHLMQQEETSYLKAKTNILILNVNPTSWSILKDLLLQTYHRQRPFFDILKINLDVPISR